MKRRDPDITKARVYDDVADVYERVNAPRLFDEPARRLVAAAALAPGSRILDVGCGTGAVSRAALEALGGDARVVGVDPAVSMLLAARRAGIANTANGALPDLPFLDNSFDGVLSAFVMSHVEDPESAVQELVRVLRPGGVVGLSAWAAAADEFTKLWTGVVHRYLDPRRLDEIARQVLPGDDRLSQPDGVAALLAAAKLERVQSIRVEIEFSMTRDEYIEAREVCATGRALRAALSPDAWKRFRADARRHFQSIPSTMIRFTRTIYIATGRKPD